METNKLKINDDIELDMSEICESHVDYEYFDEIDSWIQFNYRVINEANRSRNPILERLNFISIADSNLDEFIRTKFNKSKKEKRLILDQTNMIETVYDELIKELNDKYKVRIVSDIRSLNQKTYLNLQRYFVNNIYPLLQPLILTNKLPLPPISDGASFVVTKFENNKDVINGIIKIPDSKLIKVKDDPEYQTYVITENVILEFIQEMYKGKKILNNDTFRVLRKVDNLSANYSNYLYGIEKQLKDRDNASIQMIDTDIPNISKYRSLINDDAKKRYRKYVYGLSFLKDIKSIINYTDDMIFDKYKPKKPIDFDKSMFKTLDKNDVLLHFPYQSFDMSSVRFLQEAANDPDVISIKQTLYRVKQDSPLIEALIKAARNGKQVVVLLELKAKMDEKNNLELVKKLSDAGCNVIFGPIMMKTHAKVTFIIRKKGDKLVEYANISTGNFNDVTARIYEDLSYFTRSRNKFNIGEDLCDLFNYLGGCSSIESPNELLISPYTFRSRIESEIDKCIESKRLNPDANIYINMKCNAFTDKKIASKLYDASKVGVKIRLIIRGMCIVIPNKEGLSENIEVISVVGRYLEHSRAYEFSYKENDNIVQNIFIGSGDIMPRNLDNRVEVIIPIRDLRIKEEIHKMFDLYFTDVTNKYTLLESGKYSIPTIESKEAMCIQDFFISKYKKIAKELVI